MLAAIKELGYRPNALARDLKRRKAGTVGIVVGDRANPFYAERTQLIERQMTGADFTSIICDTVGLDVSEADRISALVEQRVAGVALVHFSGADEVLAQLDVAGIPVVGVSLFDERIDCVACDDVSATKLAVRHLTELGHRHIAYVPSLLTEASTSAARVDGWKSALRGARLPSRPRSLRAWLSRVSASGSTPSAGARSIAGSKLSSSGAATLSGRHSAATRRPVRPRGGLRR